MITTALSGLFAAQRGLETTSNNVANAGTEGYVRRRILQAEAVTAGAGIVAGLGSGVEVLGVERQYDAFLTEALRLATSTEQRSHALADLAARLDGLLGDPALGIATSIQAFFDEVELVSRDPTSVASREQLLAGAHSLAQRFHQLDSQLEALSGEVDRRLEASVSRVNAIAAALADINATVGRGGASSNDLEDRRDALLAELAGQIDATVLKQQDGTVTVLVGNGQPLVVGNRSASLTLSADVFDPTRLQVSIDLGGGPLPISRQIAGGMLGGLLAFRGEALDPARRELGLLATALSAAFNAQHAQGADSRGNAGGDFFATTAPGVLASSANGGSATVGAAIADASALQAREYVLRFDGSAWSVADAVTGQAVATTGSGTAADPLLFDGLAVTTGAGAAANDRFLVRPVSTAAGGFGIAIADAAAIAAAAPVRTARSLANLSEATITLAGIADVAHPDLRDGVQIRFESATTYRIHDAGGADLTGPLTWTAGTDVAFNGWIVSIGGTPAAGDRFDVTATPPGSGDNGNALALARVSASRFLGGTVSIDGLAGRLVSAAGATALRHAQELEIQQALREQAEVDLEGASGVNLDEEAANLLRYQQAYQAASKVIGVADEMFQTLLGMLR
jgi:flagellar hook-associated protein 1 FlgK